MYATSDGSAPKFVGSFGWAAKTDTGITLASNNGAAPGYRSTSFRAEAYGLLSYFLFLDHIFKYTKIDMCKRIKVFTDSESLIERLSDMVEWPHYYSSATMMVD